MPSNLYHGDCLAVLRSLPDCSVDAVVTDPPYGLSFMGKRWDYDVPSEDIWRECLRVLKPGGHLLAFAGTRTQHRMAVRIEDAGFEIRDMIAWVYGSGFPKSLEVTSTRAALCDPMGTSRFELATNTSLSIVSSWRRILAEGWNDLNTSTTETKSSTTIDWRTLKFSLSQITPSTIIQACSLPGGFSANAATAETHFNALLSLLQSIRTLSATGPAISLEAQSCRDAGVNPNLDPCIMARKPLSGTVAETVLAHGTGALNVDGCRVPGELEGAPNRFAKTDGGEFVAKFDNTPVVRSEGRWPANLIHDGSEEVVGLFPMANGESAARFFYCARQDVSTPEVGDNEAWQDQNQPQSSADTAPSISSLQNLLADSVQKAAAIWPSLAGILSSEQTGLSTSVTPNESSATSETAMQAMASIGSGCSQESQHERRTRCGSLVKTAAARLPTGTTTITTSLCRSDGSVEAATFTITPSNLDRGEAVFRFNYCAKASKADRNSGGVNSNHPTVKPTALMRYLCRLVTPPGGTVLDPFMGSGSTGKAAILEGFSFIGIERESEYIEIARARIESAQLQPIQADLF